MLHYQDSPSQTPRERPPIAETHSRFVNQRNEHKSESSWVDSHLARSKANVLNNHNRKHNLFPELRIQRHGLPPEFEELYARFVSM